MHINKTNIARFVSIAAHPFGMVGLLVGIPAARFSSGGGAFRSVAIVTAAVIIPLLALMVRQVRRGHWGNVDASNRSERPLLFGASLVPMALLLAYLLYADPDSFLIRGIVVCGLFILLAALLTRWIKLSLHMAFAATTATTLSLIGSPAGFLVAAIIPFLAWSRLVLARHTPLEIAVGLVFGIVSGCALVFA